MDSERLQGDPVDRQRIVLSFDSSVSSSVIGQAAREFAADAGFGAERSGRFGVVVVELIRESRTRETLDNDDSMNVELTFDGSILRCVMNDQRIPLTRAEIDAAPVHRLTALRFVDRLDITFAAPIGNHAIIEMRLENYTAVYLGLPEDEDVELDPNDIPDELEFRVMTTDDAELLVRCLYRCYGYTYPDSDLYLESHIVHLLESGKMHSTIALAPDGEIVGHSAAVFEEEGQRYPEFGKLVVDPRFRSHKIPSRMQAVEETIEFVASLPGYYGRCVTNHPISQKLGVNVGGTETGLLLGISPADVTMTGGSVEIKQADSV